MSVHGTCVYFNNTGVFLRGKSGCGKSDLALRLIDHGGVLIGDDQVVLTNENSVLIAKPVERLAGMLEVRGIGLCNFEHLEFCEISIVFDLCQDIVPERLPEQDQLSTMIEGVNLPCYSLQPFHPSAIAKIRAAIDVSATDYSAEL